MSWKREGLDLYVRELLDQKLQSTFVQIFPLLYFLVRSREQVTRLGRARTSVVLGGKELGQGQVKTETGSKEAYVNFQDHEPDDGGNVPYGGSSNTASEFAEDNAGAMRFRWTDWNEPVKVRKHSLDMARSGSEVMSIMENAVDITWERATKRFEASLRSGTLTSTQQDATMWVNALGCTHILTADNTYGGVDRSAKTQLNPKVYAAATDWATAGATFTKLRDINVGFIDNTTSEVHVGRSYVDPTGLGCNVWLASVDVWSTLADLLDTKDQIFTNGIPDHPIGGAKWPILQYGNWYVVADNQLASGTLWGLSLPHFTLEFNRDYNFQWRGWRDKSKLEEGGDKYLYNDLDWQFRLRCGRPDLQTITTGLT